MSDALQAAGSVLPTDSLDTSCKKGQKFKKFMGGFMGGKLKWVVLAVLLAGSLFIMYRMYKGKGGLCKLFKKKKRKPAPGEQKGPPPAPRAQPLSEVLAESQRDLYARQEAKRAAATAAPPPAQYEAPESQPTPRRPQRPRQRRRELKRALAAASAAGGADEEDSPSGGTETAATPAQTDPTPAAKETTPNTAEYMFDD